MNNLNLNISSHLIEEQFFYFLANNGIIPKSRRLDLIMDGKIHRFPVEDDKSGNESGAYFIHSDGCPAWGAMDFHKHGGMIKGKFNIELLSSSDHDEIISQLKSNDRNNDAIRAEMLQKKEAKKIEAEKIKKEAEFLAIKNAQLEYENNNCYSACLSTYHLYSILKHLYNLNNDGALERIFDYQVRVKTQEKPGDICKKGDLLIPLYNAGTMIFQSLQYIRMLNSENMKHEIMDLQAHEYDIFLYIRHIENSLEHVKFEKRFYKGTSTKGACFPFIPFHNERPDHIYICEGLATGASIFNFYECSIEIYAAMSCGNIIHVAKMLRAKYPKALITIAADNDKNHAGENAAIETIKAGYADNYNMPKKIGSDWNDHFIEKENERRHK